jgi:hypothetical protein
MRIRIQNTASHKTVATLFAYNKVFHVLCHILLAILFFGYFENVHYQMQIWVLLPMLIQQLAELFPALLLT